MAGLAKPRPALQEMSTIYPIRHPRSGERGAAGNGPFAKRRDHGTLGVGRTLRTTLAMPLRRPIVRLIARRELRDLLRDRRTLLIILALPIVLYPIFGLLGFLF